MFCCAVRFCAARYDLLSDWCGLVLGGAEQCGAVAQAEPCWEPQGLSQSCAALAHSSPQRAPGSGVSQTLPRVDPTRPGQQDSHGKKKKTAESLNINIPLTRLML